MRPGCRSCSALRTSSITAVFRPLKLKSAPGVAQHRSRQRIGRLIAVLGEPGERGPARIAETQQLCGLVEGFAGRVVERAAEDPVAAKALYVDQHRVPAGHQQRHERVIGRLGSSISAIRCPSM